MQRYNWMAEPRPNGVVVYYSEAEEAIKQAREEGAREEREEIIAYLNETVSHEWSTPLFYIVKAIRSRGAKVCNCGVREAWMKHDADCPCYEAPAKPANLVPLPRIDMSDLDDRYTAVKAFNALVDAVESIREELRRKE